MTYSIVARDPATGELGVAVQSHWFSVGPVVPWARPGVAAVATQANVQVAFGPRALDLMERGGSAPDVVARLVAQDPLRAHRQLAIAGADATVAAHTVSACMGFAGDVQGDGVSCQANIMVSPEVWPAMLTVFIAASGSLARRLLAALTAGESAGGDLRGRQSAAILVVPVAGEPWETVTSLRVEDHADPLGELQRLVRLDEAYRLAGRADECVAAGRHHEAARLFLEAAERAPESDELRFWADVGAAQVGDMDVALGHVRAAMAAHAGWRELLGRLTPAVAPGAGALLERLDR